MVIFDLPVIS